MDSTAPFPFSALHPQSDVSVALQTFRWLLVLGFPTAIAAATVWPDVFTAQEDDAAPASESETFGYPVI
jgi:hypothetical protein